MTDPRRSAAGPSTAVDVTNCDREPIQIPGSIQPHGILLALDPRTLTVQRYSANLPGILNRSQDSLAGLDLTALFGAEQAAELTSRLDIEQLESTPRSVATVSLADGRRFHAVAHVYLGVTFLELENAELFGAEQTHRDIYSLAREFMTRTQNSQSVRDLAEITCHEIRQLTGFGRVLVYRFDPDWHGHVIAEVRDEQYPSYMDLWFPASDIPQQARTLYQSNRLRLIADVAYEPIPIVPDLDGPLDLSHSVLRSVSPVHVEYLKNMGLRASMSISILTEGGQLWGLIACHHHQARAVPFLVRNACDFLGQALAVRLESLEQRAEYEERIRLKSSVSKLLAFVAQEDEFLQGLIKHPQELMEFLQASGAAVLYEGKATLVGVTPPEQEIWHLVDWLVSRGREEVFCTEHLASTLPEAEAFRDSASGVMAVSISKLHRSYLVWFRKEVIETVNWAGNPFKAVDPPSDGSPARLHPRTSFEAWAQTVRGRSLAWKDSEAEAAAELRNAVIGIVLRKAEELAELTAELQRSNRELESFSYSISHDLRAPFRHVAGYAELLLQSDTAKLADRDVRYVHTIINSAHYAGVLVDKLLSYSQVGRSKLHIRRVDMGLLVRESQRDLEMEAQGRHIVWQIGPMPEIEGDPIMLRLVWQNLLQNAIKYTRSQPDARITITAQPAEREVVFCVQDNGAGFDQAYADKLFGIFQRLHRMEDYEGTGIGLANVRRIVARHGGRTWAEGVVNQGASFYFTLPDQIRGERS